MDLFPRVLTLNRPDCIFISPNHPYYLCPDDEAIQELAEDMERFGPLAHFDQNCTILKTRGLHLAFITTTTSMPQADIPGNGEWFQHTLHNLHRKNTNFSRSLILAALMPKKSSVSEVWNLQDESDLLNNLLKSNEPCGHTPGPRYQDIYDKISLGNRGRLFFWTDTGRVGVTVDDGRVQAGDAIVGLFGVNLPFVLRRLENGYFRMISVARLGGHTIGHNIPEDITDSELLYTRFGLRDYEVI